MVVIYSTYRIRGWNLVGDVNTPKWVASTWTGQKTVASMSNFELIPNSKHPDPSLVTNNLTGEILIRRFFEEFMDIIPQVSTLVTNSSNILTGPVLERWVNQPQSQPPGCNGVLKNLTGLVHINRKELSLKCFSGLETWYEGSNQCELIEIASKVIEIGAKLIAGRQIESKEVN